MAEQPEQKTTLADAYEVGEPSSGALPDAPLDAGVVTAPASPPPRGPDGRFLSANAASPHPAVAVRRARDAGIADDDIREMSTPDLWQDIFTREAEQRQLKLQESILNAREGRQGLQAPQPSPPPPAPASAPARSPLDLDPDMYEGGLVAAFNHIRDQLSEMHRRLGAQEAVGRDYQAQQAQTLTERCDKTFAEFPDQLGSEKFHQLKQGDPKLARRNAVIDMARRDSSQASVEDKIRAAVKTLYGEQRQPEPPKPPKKKGEGYSPEEWMQMNVAHPTHRVTPNGAPGKQNAVQGVTNFFRDIPGAAGPGDGGGHSEEEFPG